MDTFLGIYVIITSVVFVAASIYFFKVYKDKPIETFLCAFFFSLLWIPLMAHYFVLVPLLKANGEPK
jgi:formate hydrogenlyase subunit 3/multisubunit Na+/H+ antiporter MnhD subunit